MSQYATWPVRGGSGSGVTSLNTLTGALTLAAGSNITITPSGGNTLTIASTGGGTISGAGAVGRVTFWNGTTSLTSNGTFSWNNAFTQLGIGLTSAQTAAAVDVKSDVVQTLPDPTSFSATLVQWDLPTEPTSSNANTSAPDLQKADYISDPTQNLASSGYIANGQTILYRVWQDANDLGTPTFTVAKLDLTFTDMINDGTTPFGVDITWTQNNSGLQPVTGFLLEKSEDAGANWTQWNVGAVTSVTDDNTMWTNITIAPSWPDYLANGTTRNYSAYGERTSPAPTSIDVFSVGNNPYSYNDANDGTAYKVAHANSGQNFNVRVIGSPDGTSANDYIDGANFVESPNTWNGGNTVTPTTYGYTSDGSTLSISYDYYSRQVAPPLFSVNSINVTTVDPNDGANYYVLLDNFAPSIGKIIKNGADGLDVNGETSFFDDGVQSFPNGSGIIPSSFYATAGRFAAHGGDTTAYPALAVKSIDGDYSRIDFLSNSDVPLSYIEQASSALRLFSVGGAKAIMSNTAAQLLSPSGGISLQVNNTGILLGGNTFCNGDITLSTHNLVTDASTGTKIGIATSQKLGFWNATPVVQQNTTGTTTGFTTGAGTTVHDDSTFTGGVGSTAYRISDIVRALKTIGVLAS